MPVSNGRIYRDTTVDPPLGVSVADVQRALGTSMCHESELCTHKNINVWAKYKPVKLGGNAQITDAQRASINYGIINIPKWSLFANMVNFWTAFQPHRSSYDDIEQWAPDCGVKPAYWDCELPVGGESSPYRISDFGSEKYPDRGYYAYAVPPIGAIDTAMVGNGQVTIVYTMGMDGVTAGLTLTLSDLQVMTGYSYQNLYFGVAIKAGGSSYLVTQSTRVGNHKPEGWNLWTLGAHVRFTIDEYSGGIYTCMTQNTPFDVFPILSSEPKSYESTVGEQIHLSPIKPYTPPAGTYIALYEKQTISLEMSQVYASVDMLQGWTSLSMSQHKYVFYAFTLHNVDASFGHRFHYTIYVRDANGNDLANGGRQSIDIAADGHYSPSPSTDHTIYVEKFSGAASLYMVVEVDPNDAAPLKRTSYGYAQITEEK